MESQQEILSLLFREIEHDLGTRDLNQLVLAAFMDAARRSKIDDVARFVEQFKEVLFLIKNTQPKFSIVIEHFYRIYQFLAELTAREPTIDLPELKEHLSRHLETQARDDRLEKEHLIENARKLNVEGKTILIFDHSHTVQDVLKRLKEDGQMFRVIVGEQDIEKTETIIEALDKAGIPFQVVPSYMLSHVDEEIDVLFFGCVTLKSTHQFVMDPGSTAIASEFHLEKKPLYMFTTTSKFALWKAEPRHAVYAHKHMRKHTKRPIRFERLKFSHDRVPLDLFTAIITEIGTFSPTQLTEIYNKKYEERKKWRKKLLGSEEEED